MKEFKRKSKIKAEDTQLMWAQVSLQEQSKRVHA